MKAQKFFLTSLCLLCLHSYAVGMFEIFDKMPINGRLEQNAVLVPHTGMDGLGSMKITGNGNTAQYAYRYDFDVRPGEKYGISFAHWMNPKFSNLLVMMIFSDKTGKIMVPRTQYFRIQTLRNRWKHRQLYFTAPADAVKGQMVFRLVKMPADAYVLIDNLRIASLPKNDRFFHARNLETIFDNWGFLGQQHFEHYILGPGARIVHEWKHAKVGEAFFQANGDGSRMQYPLWIENITVEPGRYYTFKCWINASDSFNYGLGMLMFVLKDASGKQLLQPRKSIRGTKGEWQECVFSFKTPANCVSLDIWLNMRNMKPENYIKIDHLRFQESSSDPELDISIDSDRQTLAVSCSLPGGFQTDNLKEILYQLTSSNESFKKSYSSKTPSLTVIDLKPVPDGNYSISAQVILKNGTAKNAAAYSFGVCKNPYWKNTIGVLKNSDQAPAPWKNLSLQKKKDKTLITGWNNIFTFTDNGQLCQIENIADQKKMLLEPVKILLGRKEVNAGKKMIWTQGTSRMTGVCPVSGDSWNGSLTVILDYMGFVRYALRIQPQKALTLNQGSISFRQSDVEFVHRADASWTAVGAVDLKKTPVWESSHNYNEIMFGNMDRGLAWHAPKVYPARLDFKRTAVRVTAKGEFTIQLINAPLSLKAGQQFQFDFALSPYPWRPAENNWRNLRFRAGKYNNFNVSTGMKPMKYCGMPASRDDTLTFRTLKNKPEVMVVYQIPFYITNTMPEWRYFAEKWRGNPARSYPLYNYGKNAKMEKCDVRDSRWQDLYVYMTDSYLRKFSWDGFYFDCYNADVLYDRGEVLHPTFECRNFQERIYLAMQGARPGAFTVTHLGANQACTSVGFSNVILMGEQYRAQCMTADYMLEFLSLREFRFENAVNVGPDRMFLPQYRQKEKINSRKIGSHLMGLVLTHNLILYPNFIERNLELETRALQYEFGMKDAEFHPYWKASSEGISTDNKTVVASYYHNSRGWFITALNSSGSEQSFRLLFPGLSTGCNIRQYNPCTGEKKAAELKENTLLPPYQCCIFVIKK